MREKQGNRERKKRRKKERKKERERDNVCVCDRDLVVLWPIHVQSIECTRDTESSSYCVGGAREGGKEVVSQNGDVDGSW